MTVNLRDIFGTSKPIIGMINLLPLPTYPNYPGMDRVLEMALTDVRALIEGGIDGLLVENSFSFPIDSVIEPHLGAAMAICTHEVVNASSVPVGVVVNMEPGDRTSLGVAVAAGARFIRSVSFNEAVLTSFGVFQGLPGEMTRYRARLGASDIAVLADIQVKYTTMMAERSIELSAQGAAMSGVDAIVVTGQVTGNAPPVETAARAKNAVGKTPVIIGSGLDVDNASELLSVADGAIVGSYFKKDGVYANAVDLEKVRQVVETARRLEEPARS